MARLTATGYDPVQVAEQWKRRVEREEKSQTNKAGGRPLSSSTAPGGLDVCDQRLEDLHRNLEVMGRGPGGSKPGSLSGLEKGQGREYEAYSDRSRRSSHPPSSRGAGSQAGSEAQRSDAQPRSEAGSAARRDQPPNRALGSGSGSSARGGRANGAAALSKERKIITPIKLELEENLSCERSLRLQAEEEAKRLRMVLEQHEAAGRDNY